GVLQQGGNRAYVHNNLAIVYQQQGKHAEAVAESREAIRLDPAYAPPRIVLGGSLLALGRVPEATTELERAVKLLPKERLAREQLARAYARGANPGAAIEQYRALRELAPEDPEYAYQLGRAYLRLSEWAMQRLRAIDPGSARIYQALGHNYRVQGRADLAVGAYEQAQAMLVEEANRNPRSPELLRLLGGVSFVRKDFLGSAIAFKKAEALAPLDERSRFTLAMSYVVLGRRNWARPELQRLSQSAPRNPLYLYWTARLDYDDGKYAAAVDGLLQ